MIKGSNSLSGDQMSFQKNVAAFILCFGIAAFLMRASGLADALGVGVIESLSIIPWWMWVAGFLFVAGGVVIERNMG